MNSLIPPAVSKAQDCLPEWSFQMQRSSGALQNHEKRNGTNFLYLISVGTGVSEHFPWLKEAELICQSFGNREILTSDF